MTQDEEKDGVIISKQFKNQVVKPILKRHFRRDEFLGRINEFVYFLPFSKSELVQLVKRELEFWAKRAKDKHGITIEWDRKALDFLVNGYDINYGARSIKYEVERRVVNQIAVAHEYGLIENGSHLLITADLPPSQQEETNLVKDPNQSDRQTKNITYDIRLKKVVKNKKNKEIIEDINLKINSFGKYFVNK